MIARHFFKEIPGDDVAAFGESAGVNQAPRLRQRFRKVEQDAVRVCVRLQYRREQRSGAAAKIDHGAE
jgi:hypothetical protein